MRRSELVIVAIIAGTVGAAVGASGAVLWQRGTTRRMTALRTGTAGQSISPSQMPAATGPSRIEPRSDDPTRGPAVAKVTLIEFADFQCPFSAQLRPTLMRLQRDFGKDLRIVWKHSPLAFHSRAMPAAIVAESAREQGKFWEMHDKLFTDSPSLSDEELSSAAEDLGLDMTRFVDSIRTQRDRSRVEEDARLATLVGATGTPTIFVNCRRVTGAQPYEQMRTIVEQELMKAEKLAESGIPLDERFYDRICSENL